MNKIALITDSTCGLPRTCIDKYNIHTAHLKIIYKNQEYIDGLNIAPEEVYYKLDEEIPTTSMPSVQDVCNLYEQLLEEGYTHAIALPISSGLSGTINSFRLAAEQYSNKITSFVFDTKILSMAVGLMAIEVGKMIQDGKDFDYICNALPKLREKLTLYFTVDTLEYLIKGGRIGKVSGSIGQLLNFKPIITMSEEGGYTTHAKTRGSKQAFNNLLSLANGILDKGKGKVVVMTGTMHEEAKKFTDALKNHKNATSIYSGIITPVVGIHSGPKILAFAILEE